MTNILARKKTSLKNTLSGIGSAILMALMVITISLVSPHLREIASTVNSGVNLAAVTVSSVFKSTPKLTLDSDTFNVNSGDIFSISWNTLPSNNETYSISFPCIEGLTLATVLEDNSNQNITCDIELPILSTKNSMILRAKTETERFTDLPITLTRTSKNIKTDSSVLITINNPKIKSDSKPITNTIPSSTEIKAPVKTEVTVPVKTPSTGSAPSNSAKPTTAGPKQETVYTVSNTPTVTADKNSDLSVKILEIGFIDKTSNTFVATSSLKSSDRVAVRFEVQNIGGRATGDWRFNAVLPTYPSYIFSSDGQQSLSAGDKIEFTIGFDHIEKADGNTVVINADPAGSINELSEENNIAKVVIDGVKF